MTDSRADQGPALEVRAGGMLTSYTVVDRATGVEYGVDITMARCSCLPDYVDPENKHAWCVHLRAAWVHDQAWHVAMSRVWPEPEPGPRPRRLDDE